MRLNVESIPVPRGYVHPPPPNEILPRHEFTMGLIAPKGSGKTTLIVNLLKFYKGYFHSIVVFSPTVASDEKWDWVKQQDLIAENKPLKDWVKKMRDKEKRDKESIVDRAEDPHELEEFVDLEPLASKRIPEEMFFNDYDEDTLREIMDEQMGIVRALKRYGKSKHLANRVLLIFDDLVGSKLFNNRKDNLFKKLNSNHRHYSTSIFMVTQAYREIPKTVRTNFSSLIVFEIPNDKEVEAVYEENSLYMKRKQWQEMYEHAVSGDHDFLFINYQKPKRLRAMKNFGSVLFVE